MMVGTFFLRRRISQDAQCLLKHGKIEQSPRYYVEKLSIDCMKEPFSLHFNILLFEETSINPELKCCTFT
jgi:hypothetical protein